MITAKQISDLNNETQRAVDAFADGPWKHEPHRIEFKHAGFDCLMVRNRYLGHWCGYVAVPKGHPAYGERYDDDALRSLDVHGGFTYTAACHGDICHRTEGPDDVWWLGFDCAHGGDLSPSLYTHRQPGGHLHHIAKEFDKYGPCTDQYRDVRYVTAEIENLAEQLRRMECQEAK